MVSAAGLVRGGGLGDVHGGPVGGSREMVSAAGMVLRRSMAAVAGGPVMEAKVVELR